MSPSQMRVKRSPTAISKSALRTNFDRTLTIINLLLENRALLLINVTPTPAMTMKSAEARPCKRGVNDNKRLLPVLGSITTVKFTMIMPSSARDRAKSKPVILSCIRDRTSKGCARCQRLWHPQNGGLTNILTNGPAAYPKKNLAKPHF